MFVFCSLALVFMTCVVRTVGTGEEMCEGSVCVCFFLHVPVCFRASELVWLADHRRHSIYSNWINNSGHLKSRIICLISPFTCTCTHTILLLFTHAHAHMPTCIHTPASAHRHAHIGIFHKEMSFFHLFIHFCTYLNIFCQHIFSHISHPTSFSCWVSRVQLIVIWISFCSVIPPPFILWNN